MQTSLNSDQICITFNNITNYFCLSEGLNVDHFENLLKVVFNIEGNILGLKSQKTGIIYDIGEFCNQNYFQLTNEIFQLIATNHTLGSPLNSNPIRYSQINRSHSNLSSSVPKQQKPTHRPLSRNKSNDNSYIPNKSSHRYSIKSASKYSNDEPCQHHVDDYEAFISLPGKENNEYLFCFFFFDDSQTMKHYGPTICKSYQVFFPSVDFFYCLYPSKRSRGPFQPSDNVMLFSFYQGHSIIIERELALSYDASEDIIKAMSQYIQKHELFQSKSEKRINNDDNTYTENSFQMINQLGSDSNFQRRDGSFSDIPNQDSVFDVIECFSKNKIRKNFTDEEFKDLLKLVRKNNKKINNIYEQFKITYDYDELVTSIRHAMNLQPSPIVPEIGNSNFQTNQKTNESSTNNILSQIDSNTNQNKCKTQKSQKRLVTNEMSFDVSSKEKKIDFQSLKGIRQFLKKENTLEKSGDSMLQNREIGYLLYGLKQNDKQLLDLLQSLVNYNKPKVIITILKAYCSQKVQNILSTHFNSKQLEIIRQCENDSESPIRAAFLNWMVLGNLNDLLSILEENVKSQKVTSILKKNGGVSDQQKFDQQFDYNAPPQTTKEQNFEYDRVALQNIQNIAQRIFDSKEPETPVYQFRYSQYALRQKKYRKPTFTLNSRQTQDNLIETLEENLAKDKDLFAIQNNLEDYFLTQDSVKDAQYNFVGEDLMKDLEEAYEYNYPPLFQVLENFKNQRNVEYELKSVMLQFRELKSQIKHLISFESPICQDKLNKYKGFLTNIGYCYFQDYQLVEKPYKILNYLFLKQDLNVISAYEWYSQDLNREEFLENIKLIEQVYFFKHTIDYSEIEQYDEEQDQINVIIYLLKSTDITSQNIQVIEKFVKFGDKELINIFNLFKQKKGGDKSLLLKQIMNFAEYRAQDVEKIEENIKQDLKSQEVKKKINNQIDTLYTISSLLKEVKYIKIVEDLVQEQHKLIRSAFEVHDFTKDKQDFIENITIIYNWGYIKQLKDTIKKDLFDQKQPKEKFTYMVDEINKRNVHIMSAWELYLKTQDISDFRDTISIILKKKYKN